MVPILYVAVNEDILRGNTIIDHLDEVAILRFLYIPDVNASTILDSAECNSEQSYEENLRMESVWSYKKLSGASLTHASTLAPASCSVMLTWQKVHFGNNDRLTIIPPKRFGYAGSSINTDSY